MALNKKICLALKLRLYNIACTFNLQEQVSGTTTATVLRGLQPDTLYTVTVYPVYAEGEGSRMSENGKTSEFYNYWFVIYCFKPTCIVVSLIKS